MKDYKEMTKCVLEARDAYEVKKGKKQSKASDVNMTSTGEVYSVKKTDKKKDMLGIAPVLGGVLVAVLIGIIVSDYSVDRIEENSTEVLTETTEIETTEEILQEASTENAKEKQKKQMPKVDDSQSADLQEEDHGTRENNENIKQSKKTVDESETDRENISSTEDDKAMSIGEKTTEEPVGNMDEDKLTYSGGESESNMTAQNWKDVIEGEGDITFVFSGKITSGGTEKDRPGGCYYKYYKGMRTTDYSFFDMDGTIYRDSGVDEITLNMLQSVDFSNADNNMKTLDAKMKEEGYKRIRVSSGSGIEISSKEPIIQRKGSGSGLICCVSYQNDNDPRFNEKYGYSDAINTTRKVSYDLITGKLIEEWLEQHNDAGELVGEPVHILY